MPVEQEERSNKKKLEWFKTMNDSLAEHNIPLEELGLNDETKENLDYFLEGIVLAPSDNVLEEIAEKGTKIFKKRKLINDDDSKL